MIVDPSTGRVVTTIFEKSVYELGFSPKGSFIITWQYPPANEPSSKNEPTENLKVFRVEDPTYNPEEPSTRQAVGQFKQRPQTGFNLQYTEDEQYCARAVTNEVHFFESSNLRKPWKKLRVEGVSHFALSPGAHPSIATFTPERKVSGNFRLLSTLLLASDSNYRGHRLLSKSFVFPHLIAPSIERISSRATRLNSYGTLLAQL